MADMPTDARNASSTICAHIVTEDMLSLALAQLPADDPPTLTLS